MEKAKSTNIEDDGPSTESGCAQRLSVVSPCFNESEGIESFYNELKKVLLTLKMEHEIIFVDDGNDCTLDILNVIARTDSSVKVYAFSRNFGHQIALSAGLDVATGDAVIVMDSDLQHPPSLIPEMVENWKKGYEIVSAVRKDTEGASFLKRFTSHLFYRIINIMSDIEIPDGTADYFLLSRKAHQTLKRMPERHRFLRGMISWLGMKRILIPYTAPKRVAGTSKYSVWKLFSLAIEAILSFSSMPLRLATRCGLLVSLFGFCYLVWILFRYFLVHDLVSGWRSLICVVLILGGIQLMFIGLIGQYVAKIFEEVKNRPLYVFKQTPSSVMEKGRQSYDGGSI